MLARTVAVEISSWPFSPARLEELQQPRDDVVAERKVDPHSFELAHGPFRHYLRTLERQGDTITQRIEWELSIPWLWWLFWVPMRHELRQPTHAEGRQPWWAPPDRLDQRSATVLTVLCVACMSVGYLNTLFTQTISFAGDDFGISDLSRGVSLAVVRSGILIALVVVALADHRGRRRIILFTAVAAPIIGAFGAIAPNFATLTATQAIGRPLALSLDMVIAVVIAEEMPKGSRAYGLGLAALAEGFGAGHCVLALKLADVSPGSWRLLYVLPLLYLFFIPAVARHLPESKRYIAPHDQTARVRDHRNRFLLLAVSGLLLNLLIAPASGFQNQFLKRERGFSAGRISLFTILTQTPAALGVLVGSVLADSRGRRKVGSVAIAVGAGATVMQFFAAGWTMWAWSFIGAMIGGAALPAIAVYQTELFPTGARARAKAGIVVITLVGSSIGLLITGVALDQGVSYGWLMAGLALGPLVVVVLVIVAYPETKALELETINPEDAAAALGPPAVP